MARSSRGPFVTSGTTPDAPRAAPSSPLPWLVALAVLVGLTYANNLSGPFVFDDLASIRDNPSIHRLSDLGRALSPPSRGQAVSGRPVVNLTLALNFAWGGLDVVGYHVWNIATHIGCALLLFGLVRYTLRLPLARGAAAGRAAVSEVAAARASAADGLAFAAALLWAVHPLQSEAVNYIVARTESTMALCYVATLYCAVRASKNASAWTAAAIAACAVGMGSKESMVTAPLMVALFDRTFVFGSWREAWSRRRGLYVGLVLTWLVLVALVLAAPRAHSAGFVDDLGPGLETGVWTYLWNQAVLIPRYLRLVAWPAGLVLDYGYVRPLTFGDVWPQAVIVAALAAGALIAPFVWPRAGFLAAWVVVTLAPSSSIVPIVTEVGAERRMYLPSMALIVAGVLAGDAGVRRLVRGRDGVRAWVSFGTLASVALALGLATRARNEEFASRRGLWQTVVDRWPHGRARGNLAAMLHEEGRRDEALELLRAAVADQPESYFDLGAQLHARGRHDDAIAALQSFLRLRPRHVNAWQARDLIGQALVAQGRLDAARDQFRAITVENPAYVPALGRLGDVLMAQERFADAVPVFEAFTAAQPNHAVAWRNLGVARARSGQVGRAIEAFSRSVELAPGDGDARRNLANALFEQRAFGRMEQQAREAVRLKPRDAVAHDLLGLALANQGRTADAASSFAQAVGLDPGNAEARAHLAEARRLLGR